MPNENDEVLRFVRRNSAASASDSKGQTSWWKAQQAMDARKPAFTLTAQDKRGIFNGQRIRRLTPTECERLQGFPDGWTKEASDSQRYKMLGNAVTVNVIEAIARRLL